MGITPSPEQWCRLVDIVLPNYEMRTGQFTKGPNGPARLQRYWDEAAEELNKMGRATKTGADWKAALQKIKSRAKEKYNKRIGYMGKNYSGGGSLPELVGLGLSPAYAKIMTLHNKASLHGNTEVPTPLTLGQNQDGRPNNRSCGKETDYRKQPRPSHDDDFLRGLEQRYGSNSGFPHGQGHSNVATLSTVGQNQDDRPNNRSCGNEMDYRRQPPQGPSHDNDFLRGQEQRYGNNSGFPHGQGHNNVATLSTLGQNRDGRREEHYGTPPQRPSRNDGTGQGLRQQLYFPNANSPHSQGPYSGRYSGSGGGGFPQGQMQYYYNDGMPPVHHGTSPKWNQPRRGTPSHRNSPYRTPSSRDNRFPRTPRATTTPQSTFNEDLSRSGSVVVVEDGSAEKSARKRLNYDDRRDLLKESPTKKSTELAGVSPDAIRLLQDSLVSAATAMTDLSTMMRENTDASTKRQEVIVRLLLSLENNDS